MMAVNPVLVLVSIGVVYWLCSFVIIPFADDLYFYAWEHVEVEMPIHATKQNWRMVVQMFWILVFISIVFRSESWSHFWQWRKDNMSNG